jgi:hypothetical protein
VSIIISNVARALHHDNEPGYEIRINEELVALFRHIPSDGLAECLRRAADAVDATQPTPDHGAAG